MNQTKKRLGIIQLAIAITDIEAIKLQMLRLQPLRSDDDIHHILSLLEEENYVQAQEYIHTYIDNPTQTVIQRVPEEETLDTLSDELEVEAQQSDKEEHITEVYIENEEQIASTLYTQKDTQYSKEKIDFNLQHVPKDNFFDEVEKPEGTESLDISIQTKVVGNDTIETANTDSIKDTITEDCMIEETESIADILQDIDTPTLENSDTPEEAVIYDNSTNSVEETTHYDAIANIEDKIEMIHLQYPAIHIAKQTSDEVQYWITKLSTKGYSETDITEVLQRIETLATSDKAQAAELLLVTAVTQSPYAQFILARALYRGSLLQRNLDESFTIMSRLAYNDKFAEALCDLAQFYENGVAVDKDKKQAKALYKEAMHLGIHRAQKHYQRLENEGKGLFSFLTR